MTDNLPLLENLKNTCQKTCFEPYEQEYGQEEQYYHLKWHNHQSNLTFELAELQQFETFVDVTLSTMDGNSINCHKVCKQLKYLVLDFGSDFETENSYFSIRQLFVTTRLSCMLPHPTLPNY